MGELLDWAGFNGQQPSRRISSEPLRSLYSTLSADNFCTSSLKCGLPAIFGFLHHYDHFPDGVENGFVALGLPEVNIELAVSRLAADHAGSESRSRVFWVNVHCRALQLFNCNADD